MAPDDAVDGFQVDTAVFENVSDVLVNTGIEADCLELLNDGWRVRVEGVEWYGKIEYRFFARGALNQEGQGGEIGEHIEAF